MRIPEYIVQKYERKWLLYHSTKKPWCGFKLLRRSFTKAFDTIIKALAVDSVCCSVPNSTTSTFSLLEFLCGVNFLPKFQYFFTFMLPLALVFPDVKIQLTN